jgi:hypothetical protein
MVTFSKTYRRPDLPRLTEQIRRNWTPAQQRRRLALANRRLGRLDSMIFCSGDNVVWAVGSLTDSDFRRLFHGES